MGEKTAIAWTDHTFNPWWGCTKVSPACDNCYAEAWAKRCGYGWGDAPRRFFGDKHWAAPLKWSGRVFCASMADVFDNAVDQAHRERLWALIRATPNLTWQLLTKRIGNARAMLPADFNAETYPNVWLGATVVTQEEFDRDIEKLVNVQARVRWLSIEPQQGEIWMLPWLNTIGAVSWVVTGGESGGHARPYKLDWARSVVEQCREAAIAPFVKQLGANPVVDYAECSLERAIREGGYTLKHRAGADPSEWPIDLRVQEFPK